MGFQDYWLEFCQLLTVPFQNLDTVWGILPVYATLILGEIYEGRMNYGKAVINGVVMMLAGLDWTWHLSRASSWDYIWTEMSLPWVVTAACVGVGAFTIVLGLRRKDKTLAAALGHSRFCCYFIILLYPLQARLVPWSMAAVVAILVFALPAWLIIYLCGRLVQKVLK